MHFSSLQMMVMMMKPQLFQVPLPWAILLLRRQHSQHPVSRTKEMLIAMMRMVMELSRPVNI